MGDIFSRQCIGGGVVQKIRGHIVRWVDNYFGFQQVEC